jgi:DNA-binding CsgD family transcriptional regulator/PAS domain-containing protein
MGIWKLDLIEAAFADAALNPSAWAKALNLVTAQTESYGAVLIPVTGGAVPNIPMTDAMSASAERYFCEGWYLRDERNYGFDTMMQRGVVDDLDISHLDKIKRHPYYQEFLAPHGLRWFAGVRVAAGDDVWCLSIQRQINQEPFSRAEKNRLARMSDRLSTTAVLARALGTASANGTLEAFEMSGKAVLLVNRRGEIFQANKSAEQLLGGDVRIERRKLVSFDASATAALNRSLHELIFRSTAASLAAPVLLPRRGRRPILAYPARLSAATANPLADCQAIVVLVNLDKPHGHLPETVLQTAFNLTAAEARLAARMASGLSLEAVTDQIGIAKETGRNQLKSIFAKAKVQRQSELVAVLSLMLGQRKTGR